MTDVAANLPEGPDAVGLDPPAPVFMVDEGDVVITEPLPELHSGMPVAIPNPWSDGENYVRGKVIGKPGRLMLDVGNSLGKLELREQGWCCVGLARKSVIIDSMPQGPLVPGKPKSFTSRLLKRTGTKKRKKR